MTNKKSLILRAEEIADSMQTFSHPWNPNSEISGTYMGRMVGLKRTGANFAVIPAGKESFVYHSHHCEEEWIYILSGQAIAEIDKEEFEVFPGNFMA
ncbi:cupin domain-containing protein [Nostoc sp.]|uniref:cupin domain-containing protein n=1 Tax=Nostoc sp. TaxID=1180 RepID=UPI002FF62013